jgi:hypothetical protein
MEATMIDPHLAHCVEKIGQLVALGAPGRREVLQLGYNLGRLSERTGAGREPFWDRWKEAVATWDQPRLALLARDLRSLLEGGSATGQDAVPDPPIQP